MQHCQTFSYSTFSTVGYGSSDALPALIIFKVVKEVVGLSPKMSPEHILPNAGCALLPSAFGEIYM